MNCGRSYQARTKPMRAQEQPQAVPRLSSRYLRTAAIEIESERAPDAARGWTGNSERPRQLRRAPRHIAAVPTEGQQARGGERKGSGLPQQPGGVNARLLSSAHRGSQCYGIRSDALSPPIWPQVREAQVRAPVPPREQVSACLRIPSDSRALQYSLPHWSTAP